MLALGFVFFCCILHNMLRVFLLASGPVPSDTLEQELKTWASGPFGTGFGVTTSEPCSWGPWDGSCLSLPACLWAHKPSKALTCLKEGNILPKLHAQLLVLSTLPKWSYVVNNWWGPQGSCSEVLEAPQISVKPSWLPCVNFVQIQVVRTLHCILFIVSFLIFLFFSGYIIITSFLLFLFFPSCIPLPAGFQIHNFFH